MEKSFQLAKLAVEQGVFAIPNKQFLEQQFKKDLARPATEQENLLKRNAPIAAEKVIKRLLKLLKSMSQPELITVKQ